MESGNASSSPSRPKSDAIMIELLFKFALLMEAQLLDLQQSVRKFVEDMNMAIMRLDSQVSEEGKQAQQIYESIFTESDTEAQIMNERAATRVDDIIAQLLGESGNDAAISDDLKNSFTADATKAVEIAAKEARDEVWSKISKKLESVTRLEERLRPQVFTIIKCLNFEDIQSQRLEHLLHGYKALNEGMMRHLQTHAMQENEAMTFAQDFLKRVRTMYTMEEERKIFDAIFTRPKT